MKRSPIYLLPLVVLFITQGELLAQRTKSKNATSQVQAPIIKSPDWCLNKVLSINVHIVRDSLRQAGISEAVILKAIEDANTYFKPICLSFKVCKFNYIENWKYNSFSVLEEVAEVKVLYNVKKTINMYFAQNVSGPKTEPGFAYNPTDPASAIDNKDSSDVVVIEKGSANGKFISHELGHLLGLYDTFESVVNGPELVNASNCVQAGDLICDTEADVTTLVGYFNGCKYIATVKDSKNNYYTPPIDNIMSDHPLNCRLKFTNDQYSRMSATFLNFRKYLY